MKIEINFVANLYRIVKSRETLKQTPMKELSKQRNLIRIVN